MRGKFLLVVSAAAIAAISSLPAAVAFVPVPLEGGRLTVASSCRLHESLHVVDDLVCREMRVSVPSVGEVTVLEATEESQDQLEHMAMSLAFDLGDNIKLTEGDAFGATLWPPSSALADYLLNKCEDLDLASTSLLELGAGTGLISIAAALKGASVTATDFEPFPLQMLKFAASTFHKDIAVDTKLLDLCKLEDRLPKCADVVVASDVMYQPETAVALAQRTKEALDNGSRVIIGDSPGRPGRPYFLDTLKKLGVTDISVVESSGLTKDDILDELIELPVQIMDLKPSNVPSAQVAA